jgi:hypothetical protein
MAKIIIKNGPKDPFQMAKLVGDIATRQIDVPTNGIVDARETKKTAKLKKGKK